jgi:HD-GYP domain-containing protein (c-di-GMP phosphodiesterase class II)
MAVRLAEHLGVTEPQLTAIRRGSLLHDIGKAAVPQNILHKPGPLNLEEWEIVRRHPEAAREMLENHPELRDSLDIPYCHHERWDGTGYPRGLRGDEIPLAARIFAVVDVWNALRTDQPYRAAWSEDAVLVYIRQQSGSQFDPHIAEVFLEMINP